MEADAEETAFENPLYVIFSRCSPHKSHRIVLHSVVYRRQIRKVRLFYNSSKLFRTRLDIDVYTHRKFFKTRIELTQE